MTMGAPSGVKDRIPHELLSEMLRTANTKNHEFSSEDGQWKINLTRTFIALSTGNYKVWEDFKKKLEIPLTALIHVYSPSYFSRIGLRYKNVIQRSTLDLAGVSWTKLLRPQILGVLVDSEVSQFVQNLESGM